MISLNDDCLLHIFEYLNFAEQSSVAHTCQRLLTIVENSWEYKYKNVKLDYEQCLWFEAHKQYFFEFMRCICKNIEQLQLERIDSKTFHMNENLDFPNAVSLLVNIRYTNESKKDEDVKLIVKLFPQLTKLSLCCSSATGKYLWNLKNLTELELGGCEDLATKYFKRIFSTLRLKKLNIMYYGYNTCFDELTVDIAECKTLEEISIDDHHLLLLIRELPKLKKLQKLIVYTRDYDTYLLEKLTEQFGNSMDTMIFDDVFWSKDEHCECIKHMKNLRRLLLHDDDIEKEHLKSIGKCLGNSLREFRFVDGRDSEIIDGLVDFIDDCKHLEVFDFSRSKLNLNFLRKIIDKISVDFKNRKSPLLIRCFETGITEEDAEMLTVPGRIEISLLKEEVRFPGRRCFQCEWKLS